MEAGVRRVRQGEYPVFFPKRKEGKREGGKKN